MTTSIRQQEMETAAREERRKEGWALLGALEAAMKEAGRAEECYRRRDPIRPTMQRYDMAMAAARKARIQIEGLLNDALSRGRWAW